MWGLLPSEDRVFLGGGTDSVHLGASISGFVILKIRDRDRNPTKPINTGV